MSLLVQVSKKDRVELPKTVTITPSESTHFRVILSSEAMEAESGDLQRAMDSVCTIVKPQPRTPKSDLHCSKLDPQDPISKPHHPINDSGVPKPDPCPAKPEPRTYTSEPCVSKPDLCTPKPERRTRWTSSPPSGPPPGRRDSGSAACAASHIAGVPGAVCPDMRSKTDSPSKRRSNLPCLLAINYIFKMRTQ